MPFWKSTANGFVLGIPRHRVCVSSSQFLLARWVARAFWSGSGCWQRLVPLVRVFTSQICRLFAWHVGEEGKWCSPESMVKSRAAKQTEKDLGNLLGLAWERSVWLCLPCRLFRNDPYKPRRWCLFLRGRDVQMPGVHIFMQAVLFLFTKLSRCGLCRWNPHAVLRAAR